MASHIRRIVSNTRERILSTDANNATALHHRALVEASAAILLGDASIFGVIRGLTVSTSGGVLTVTVAPGLALRSGTAATTYDSATQWIELRSSQALDLAANVDGANPRWVVIEIAEASAVESSEARDIFDPLTGTFSSSSITKVSGSSPTLTARAGTAAAAPVFPAGIAGVIPLGYVYLAAAAASINVSDIVMCRPMLRGDGGGDQAGPQREMWGGGVSVGIPGTSVVLRNAGGRFASHRTRWGLQATDGTTTYAVTAPGYDGAAAPVADDVVYFYAAPAPYPAGYDTNLAAREHRPGATALTRYQGMVCADLTNAVIVVSVVEPQVNTPQGNPSAGDFEITCAPFSAVGTPVDIDRTTAVYLGAAYWDVSATDFLAQSILGDVIQPATSWTPAASITSNLATAVDLRSAGSPTRGLLPITLSVADVQIAWEGSAAGDVAVVTLDDEVTSGVSETSFALLCQLAGDFTSHRCSVYPDADGEVQVSRVFYNGGSSDPTIRVLSYKDSILSTR
jgi:hypothetical protein